MRIIQTAAFGLFCLAIASAALVPSRPAADKTTAFAVKSVPAPAEVRQSTLP